MIDFGLLASLIIAFGVPSLVASWWTVRSSAGPIGFLDVSLGPAFAGVAVARLTTLVLDDPASIGSISDMLIIRSGVEFWPGVVAAVAIALWSARRAGDSPAARVADLAPLAMVGYAGYEAACVFRDGCFGPESPIGLRPPGLSTPMLPMGWLMGIAVAVAAVAVHGLVARRHASIVVALTATAAVASIRALGSIWLPHVGDGLTRQHISSVAVAAATGLAAIATVMFSRGQRSIDTAAPVPAPPHTTTSEKPAPPT